MPDAGDESVQAHTMPCPQCKTPVQKVDGCNHVVCLNPSCLHHFSWLPPNHYEASEELNKQVAENDRRIHYGKHVRVRPSSDGLMPRQSLPHGCPRDTAAGGRRSGPGTARSGVSRGVALVQGGCLSWLALAVIE